MSKPKRYKFKVDKWVAGGHGPELSYSKTRHGYSVWIKYFMKPPECIGSVSKGLHCGLRSWGAYSPCQTQSIDGAPTRRIAAIALAQLVGAL